VLQRFIELSVEFKDLIFFLKHNAPRG
jgi:hypothetical protein